MPRFCLLPYNDSESDSDEDMWVESDETHHPPAVGSNVNGRWVDPVSRIPREIVLTASDKWMDADAGASRDESCNEFINPAATLKKDDYSGWQQCTPVASTKAVLSRHQNISSHHTESTWKQWNNENSIAFAETLHTTLCKVNDSIQERIQVEREKLELEHRQENNQIQILCENPQVQTSTNVQETREQNEDKTEVVGTDEPKFEHKRVDNTTERIHPVEMKPQTKDDTGNKKSPTNENIQASAPAQTSKSEHVLKAESLLEQLTQLQKSVEPFSKNKTASKRRLKMKKAICGKLNTLTDSAAKVKEIADEVISAIQSARQEDAQNPDMALGESYLLDLLASNIIQRIQAESFSGPRGDGFPLAAMIAQAASENEKAIPVLEAHIYKVCPMAIPRFPDEATATTSEDKLMESLGMQRDKNGDFESWDRFASRTENIIAMMANIQASTPATHSLLGGHQGAADWLERFLESLPPTTPLPLLTAPVLHGFLSGAGCMLANKYDALFKKSLQTLSGDVIPRLDKGAIGKPSFIRLSKLLENDFDGFRSKLPAKAIPQLYIATTGEAVTNKQPLPTKNSTIGRKRTPRTAVIVAAASRQPSESTAEDVIMSDAFGNEPVTMTSPFSSPNSNHTSNGSHVFAPFGVSSSSSPFGSGSVQPTHGFGFPGGHDQPRNPFEGKQGLGSQICFGKSTSTLFCQKTQPNTGPPCKYFAMGTCRFGSKCRYSHES
mmetsp:Transcript_32204/g.78246  ORF Transcript_32204/g.78246 Transcript_32204/m.78246 type:complete len:724 (-) Transcript_32204:133-2304(-)